MKKIVFVLIATLVLMLSGCGAVKNNQMINTDRNIIKITITTGGVKQLKTTENKNEIIYIVNYINGLDLKKTTEDVIKLTGGSCVITIYFNNKINKQFVNYGNLFFKESGKEWYAIPYKQANKIYEIYNNLE